MSKVKGWIVTAEHSQLGQQLMRVVRIAGVGIAADILTGQRLDAMVVVALVEAAWRIVFPTKPAPKPTS